MILGGITEDLPTTEAEVKKSDEAPKEPDAGAALQELEKTKAPATTSQEDLSALGL